MIMSTVAVPLSLIMFCLAAAKQGDRTVECYDCTASGDYNCWTGQCTGDYCYKSIQEIQGQKAIRKGCDYGTLEQQRGCTIKDLNLFSGHVATRGTYCTCDRNYCNGAISTLRTSMHKILWTLIATIFIFVIIS